MLASRKNSETDLLKEPDLAMIWKPAIAIGQDASCIHIQEINRSVNMIG